MTLRDRASTTKISTEPSTGASIQTSTRETFPFWVKRWRAYLGVTQKRFAELWGVSPSMVQKIEANDYGVGQLSFDRLESLRGLLGLEPSVFYGILSHNDPGDTGDTVRITRLAADLTVAGSVALPAALLGGYQAGDLLALELPAHTFAPDRLRYALSPGSLVVVKKAIEDAAPLPLDLLVGTKTLRGQRHLVIFRYSEEDAPLFLRPFDPDDERCLELAGTEEVDLIGAYVGHWSSLGTR